MSTKKNLCPKLSTRNNRLDQPWFVYYYDAQGKRVRVYGDINQHFTAEARTAAANKIINALTGSRLTLTAVDRIAAYIEQERHRWRNKTYQTYYSKLQVFREWAVDRDLSAAVLSDFFRHLSETRHSSTRNWYIVFFRTMLKAIGEPLDIIDQVEKRKSAATPAAYFQKNQIARIKKHLTAKDPELWFFCQWVYYCFVRPGELRLLKIEDVLLDDYKLRIPAAVSKNRATQLVTIPVQFRNDIKCLEERAPTEYIFHRPGQSNKPYSVNYFSEKHRQVLRELGFSSQHKLYSWKHTGAVNAVKAGVTVKELQVQLRHHSLEMVDKYLRQLGAWDLGDLENAFPGI